MELSHLRRDVGDIENTGPIVNASLWALCGVTTLFLIVRLLVKVGRKHKLWWDDCFLSLAWACLLAETVLMSAAIHLGFGKRPTNINPQNLSIVLLLCQLVGSFIILATAWSKTAIASSLLKISGTGLKKILWAIIISLNLLHGVTLFVQWASCTPVEKHCS
ncbi:hypothetical protein F5883DRAFT_442171 [Diaporthe sp. PMI_573]|nr:hypothetical protein F5883DRAFT_442171 [Diaporthaceae sp. PMI_573]